MSGHQQSSAGSRSISAGPHTGSAHRTSRHQLPSGAAQAKPSASAVVATYPAVTPRLCSSAGSTLGRAVTPPPRRNNTSPRGQLERARSQSPSSFPERDMSPRTRANAARMAVEGERRQGADNARKLQEARRQQLAAQRTAEHEERVRHAAAVRAERTRLTTEAKGGLHAVAGVADEAPSAWPERSPASPLVAKAAAPGFSTGGGSPLALDPGLQLARDKALRALRAREERYKSEMAAASREQARQLTQQRLAVLRLEKERKQALHDRIFSGRYVAE
uniref:Uncharacterized protein n=1 Tax=Haptolina ericina TaxID=156174 RepID=A0A7S3B3M6_9EUKA